MEWVRAIQMEDAPKILKLLQSKVQLQNLNPTIQALDEKWIEIIHLNIQIAALHPTEYPATAKLRNKQAQAFHLLFQNHGKWALPLLYYINGSLMKSCVQADEIEKGHLEEAVRTVYKAFSCCLTDRFSPPESSRKWGTYHILKSINLCTNVLRALDATADLPPIEEFPKEDRVGYSYWIGVLHFLNEKYKESETFLLFAFTNTAERKNHHQVLKYLIPLRLKRGILPTSSLIEPYYDLKSIFNPFLDSIKKGDVKAFDCQSTRVEQKLVEWGIFSIIEKCRFLCLRVLFKKIWLISDSENKLPLSLFSAGINFNLQHAQALEDVHVECIMANMIDKGLVKGYLSHEKQMVVLSQKDPFPSLENL